MIFYKCPDCGAAFLVNPMDPDLHLLQRYMPCPSFECGGSLRKMFKQQPPKEAKKLKAVQLYQATMGFGLPREKNCTPEKLRKVMVGAMITAIDVTQVGDHNRSIITTLKLSTGHQVHFASSALGATIYRMTKDAS
jgi:hypothetical protein